ncbi:hypothetical protein V6M85_11365 [Sulfolobus tengchongensis]|uniref:Uncharacterized protein n=1 Tax=Sulfolobus tengchongensis TaxID=207809 RepID=A0AAX4L0B1_9CREN
MFIKNPEPNTETVYDYINRVVAAVVNAIISYNILYEIIPVEYVYFTIAAISVISFFFYKQLSIILLALYIIDKAILTKAIYYLSLYPLIQFYSIKYLIELIIVLVFLFVIPLISILKFRSNESVITSDSLLLALYNPYLILFLPFGISEKNNKISVNVLSVLPLLVIPILQYYSFPYNPNLWISLALIVISGILFGLKYIFSLAGIIPLDIFLYISNEKIEIIALITLISAILNLIPSILSIIETNFYIKREIVERKSKINESLNEVKSSLDKIKLLSKDSTDMELFSIIQKYEKFFSSVSANLETIADIKSLQNIEMEINAKKLELERNINDYLFDQISQYNEIVEEIKNYGIVLDRIEPLSEPIKIDEDDTIKISKLLSRISENMNILSKYVENMTKSLKTLLGKNYDSEITDIRLDIKKSIIYIKELASKENIDSCKACVELLIKFLQMLNSLNLSTNQELLKILIKLNDEKPATFIIKSEEIMEQGLKLAIDTVTKLKEEYKRIQSEIPSLDRYKEFELINLLEKELNDNTKPICKRMEALASFLQVIQDLSSIVTHKNEIADVINLVSDNYDLILQKVLEEGCIKLSDLGIALDYSKFIDLVLQEKGSTLKIVGDSICYMK